MTTKRDALVAVRNIEGLITEVRGQRVILDSDLAAMYGVPTKALNQAIQRNADRFPDDFAFHLSPQEVTHLKSQIVTSSLDGIRSQFVTASEHGGRRKPPFAFTEHGALMAANVLRSPKAVEMSVFIVRAFVRMRGALVSQYEMATRLEQIEKVLLMHDGQLKELFDTIRPLLLPPPDPPTKRMVFHVNEARGKYGVRRQKARG